LGTKITKIQKQKYRNKNNNLKEKKNKGNFSGLGTKHIYARNETLAA
jgi:hypothetical protein